MGRHHVCTVTLAGSIPVSSTIRPRRGKADAGLRSRLSLVRVQPRVPSAGGATGCARSFYLRGWEFESPAADQFIALSFSGRTSGSDPENGSSNLPEAAISSKRNRMRAAVLTRRLRVRVSPG